MSESLSRTYSRERDARRAAQKAGIEDPVTRKTDDGKFAYVVNAARKAMEAVTEPVVPDAPVQEIVDEVLIEQEPAQAPKKVKAKKATKAKVKAKAKPLAASRKPKVKVKAPVPVAAPLPIPKRVKGSKKSRLIALLLDRWVTKDEILLAMRSLSATYPRESDAREAAEQRGIEDPEIHKVPDGYAFVISWKPHTFRGYFSTMIKKKVIEGDSKKVYPKGATKGTIYYTISKVLEGAA